MKSLLLILPMLCLSTSVLAKVTYEDAVESNRPYHDYNGSIHNPPDTQGLTDAEQPDGDDMLAGMGHWVKVSSRLTDVVNAGAYSALLSPDSEGQVCYKGTKGLILGVERECHHWNSGGTHCQGSWVTTISDDGYKAECK